MVSLSIVSVPDVFCSVTPFSDDSLPLPVIVQFVIDRPLTALPLMPIWPELITERRSTDTVVAVRMLRLATHWRLLPPIRSPPQFALAPATVWAVPLPGRFMFFSVMLLEVANFRPLAVQLWIVPPEPAVVPVPLTVKLPVAALTFTPFPSPLALRAWKVYAPVAVAM